MKKRESTFLNLDWPFKVLGKGIKKIAVGFIDFFKNDELRELSESLDRSMARMSESLEKMKKSTEKYREYNKAITTCTQDMVDKITEQNLVSVHNELAAKTRELERIVVETRRRSYLQNRIWRDRQN